MLGLPGIFVLVSKLKFPLPTKNFPNIYLLSFPDIQFLSPFLSKMKAVTPPPLSSLPPQNPGHFLPGQILAYFVLSSSRKSTPPLKFYADSLTSPGPSLFQSLPLLNTANSSFSTGLFPSLYGHAKIGFILN